VKIKEHRFEATIRWSPTDASPLAIQAAAPDRPEIALTAAPAFRGDPKRTNPEELLAIAVSSCQLLTYLAFARRAGLEVKRYEDHPVAILAAPDGKMRITEVQLEPRIGLAPGSDLEKARAVVEEAHKNCFIASSVNAAVKIVPALEIVQSNAA
jgi:organic hydroperoxide reductase OsmC/OhrA